MNTVKTAHYRAASVQVVEFSTQPLSLEGHCHRDSDIRMAFKTAII